jgi:hypothetical protein
VRLSYLICLTLAIALAACGGSKGAPPGPTALPSTPTAVAQAAPEGWKEYDAAGLSFYAPVTYVGGQPTSEDYKLVVQSLRQRGADQVAALLEQAQGTISFKLFLVGTAGDSINVLAAPMLSTTPLDRAVDLALTGGGTSLTVLNRRNVMLGPQPSVRILATYMIAGTKFRSVQYALKGATQLWIVSYGSSDSGFDALLGDFDRSAQTIRLGATPR